MRGWRVMLLAPPGRERIATRRPMAVGTPGMHRVGAPGVPRWTQTAAGRCPVLARAASRGPDRPAGALTDEAEHRETRQVGRGSEEAEVGVHLGSPPDPGPPPAVATAHEVGDPALDLRTVGPVVGLPVRVTGRRPAAPELRLVGSHRDAASPAVGGAAGGQGAGGAGHAEGGDPARARRPQRHRHARRAGDRARPDTDGELVLAGATSGSDRWLDLDPDGRSGGLQGPSSSPLPYAASA